MERNIEHVDFWVSEPNNSYQISHCVLLQSCSEWQRQINKIHFNLKNLITHFLINLTCESRAGSRWPADLRVYSGRIAWQLRFGLLISLQRDSENRHNPESSISHLGASVIGFWWLEAAACGLRRSSRLCRFVGGVLDISMQWKKRKQISLIWHENRRKISHHHRNVRPALPTEEKQMFCHQC